MKRLSALLLSLVFVATSALAADPVPPVKPATTGAKPAAVPAKSDPRAASGPVKTAQAGSQQNRMKECNKQATGKKGAERKAFMKSCLSTRKS
ncbi:MAG TPA: PsiF family protein [Casimicrobiaceae bacterium]|nr:PsiF family protein [Casimicrobiaceae bacterium]